MGMQGNLQDMAVADLIQQYCQDRKTAQLKIDHADQQAVIFIKEGNVVHAISGDLSGEEVVFQALMWVEGTFSMDTGIESPDVTITRNWSSLLLEGMRYQDEEILKAKNNKKSIQLEEKRMSEKIADILKEMSGEIVGYIASAVVGMDGLNIADHSATKVDPEIVSAQMTLLLQQVDSTVTKLGAGMVEENLMTTENSYMLMRFLTQRNFFLLVDANRKTGNLGNLRMITKLYANRISEALPNNPKPKSKDEPEIKRSVFSFP